LPAGIKITTPNDRPHVIRVLEMAAGILRDELEPSANHGSLALVPTGVSHEQAEDFQQGDVARIRWINGQQASLAAGER
jgi:hypothetical protein